MGHDHLCFLSRFAATDYQIAHHVSSSLPLLDPFLLLFLRRPHLSIPCDISAVMKNTVVGLEDILRR